MDVQSKTFEQLLDESTGGSGLSLEIKKAEMATSDLTSLVQATAQSENSRFDIIRVIPGASHTPSNEAITETFVEAMNTLSVNMRRLILEAEVNIGNLQELEERMSTIYDLIAREDISVASAKEELMGELWTKLGGNKKMLRGFNQHLSLLRDLGEYRKQALVHVVTVVAAPELVGSRIPVEVHIKASEMGRMKAKGVEEATIRRVLGITSNQELTLKINRKHYTFF
ncbi:hypothetical protein BDQ17DRAFT_1359325 [Cyathus striatus]|nr:hypothetical protein BDQ17DRAFT_1359325 [Cyathus striatus]